MDAERSAATEAENKPVYHDCVAVNVCGNMNVDTRTYENEDPISTRLPAIGHLLVFVLRNLRINGINLSRTLIGAGCILRCLR
jgi:hypothetical protein